MNYKDLNDNEIIYNIRENNEEANELLFMKYDPLIKATAKRISKYAINSGFELNDFMQEGRIALSSAIQQYDEQNCLFYTYAKNCIEKRMINLVAKSASAKNRILNNSIPFETIDDDGEHLIFGSVLEDEGSNPEDIVINSENEKDLIERIKNNLTDFESQVFDLKIAGFTYKEIAEILDKSAKSIDNAFQRIKQKAKEKI